ncbi:MAG TPA: hypothetical protein VJ935_09900, partial [Acidimicrobiia bacterium]|nr:hypothetical protein [Acidimicrobiia bacterium]
NRENLAPTGCCRTGAGCLRRAGRVALDQRSRHPHYDLACSHHIHSGARDNCRADDDGGSGGT